LSFNINIGAIAD